MEAEGEEGVRVSQVCTCAAEWNCESRRFDVSRQRGTGVEIRQEQRSGTEEHKQGWF